MEEGLHLLVFSVNSWNPEQARAQTHKMHGSKLVLLVNNAVLGHISLCKSVTTICNQCNSIILLMAETDPDLTWSV